ncbi:hypothetical protein BOTBODRAFT_36284 [Botryobasidium botryosum FD-172 SS1]|uniref:AB hydrolase-1 domain-containing protein n=1 Tax=Botryobasidium botryosum (strain FD-172 SS1) TaxID=930990 RepID=A0A067MFQ0_BOTB1|nr:hypothetical protein BOTBODRAFT_36284 [Botryobasidium botryosum FD-172 SS1]
MAETELPTFFDPRTCVRKGLCPIKKKCWPSTHSHNLYYEQHGSGPEKIIFVMGLNNSCFGWVRQVAHFGDLDKYSVLVFDNRGVGNSDAPWGPYTTSAMAEDAIALLDFMGWTEVRGVHIVGISLGGMISMEIASRIPERIASLTLTVTTAGGSPAPAKGLSGLLRAPFMKDPEEKIALVMTLLYPDAWLDAPSADQPGKTNREVQVAGYRVRVRITRPQPLMGALSQMWAAVTHRVSAARLKKIESGIPKVLIITGDADDLVAPSNSEYLARVMRGAEYIKWEGTGHAINGQWPDRFNAILEQTFREGRDAVNGGTAAA